MAKYLDLSSDDPDSWEGKLVTLEGRDYEIGPFLGGGADQLVHVLVNTNSGLGLLVIKIPRALTGEADVVRSLSEATSMLRRDEMLSGVVTPVVPIHSHGGSFLVQPLVGSSTYSDGTGFNERWELASQASAAGNDSEAARIYGEELARNPANTVALFNLGGIHLRTDAVADGLALIERAVEIEPMLLDYRRGWLAALLSVPLPRSAHAAAQEVIRVYGFDADAVAAKMQALLLMGQVDEAEEVLTTSGPLPSNVGSQLSKEIRRVRRQNRKTRRHSDRALNLVKDGRLDEAVSVLREASQLNPESPYHRANFALLLGNDSPDEAAAILTSSVEFAVPPVDLSIAFNAAVNWARADEWEQALSLLSTCMDLVAPYTDEPEFSWSDLPGIAVWYQDGQIIEASPQTWLPWIDLFAVRSRASAMPGAETFIDLYAAHPPPSDI